MPNSAHIARLLGPALIGITVTEWINLHIFAAAAGPTFATHVYLNGTLIFIAGLGRMIAPISSQQTGQNVAVLYGSIVLLLIVGVILTYKSLGRAGRDRP